SRQPFCGLPHKTSLPLKSAMRTLRQVTTMNTSEPGLSAPAWPSDEAYGSLEHTGSLKGLLKPFKGKGELQLLTQLAQRTEGQLSELMAGLEQRAKHPPCSLLDLRLCRQNTRAGIPYLRWRSRDFSRMGVAVWAQQLDSAVMTHPQRE